MKTGKAVNDSLLEPESVDVVLEAIRRDILRDAHALEVALESMPVGVSWARVDDQTIVFTNRKFTEMFGYTSQDLSTIDDWIERAYPFLADRQLASQKWGEYFERPDRAEFTVEPIEICVRSKSGETKTAIVSGVILPDTGWALATFVDISDRKRSELQLRTAEQQAVANQAIYRTLLDNSPEMMVLFPFNGDVPYVSPAVEKLTGFRADEYLSLRDQDYMHPDDRADAATVLKKLRQGYLSQTLRYRALQATGSYGWVEANLTGYLDPGSGTVAGYVASIRDCSEQKRREDKLASENQELSLVALRDELTGIANRRRFNETLRKESLRQTRSKHDLSLLLLDVDCFKQYNDRYGHLAGDECLRRIAETVQTFMRRESDLVARFGGEEFVVLLPMTDTVGARVIANRIREGVAALGIPHTPSPHGVVSVSVGSSTWAAGEELEAHTLISRADAALYEAKKRGRNCIWSSEVPRREINLNVLNAQPNDPGERRRPTAFTVLL